MTTAPRESGSGPPVPRRRSRRRPVLVAAAIVVVVIGIVAASGGFADVPDEAQPAFGLGDTFDNGLYRITFESVEVTDLDPGTGLQREGDAIVLRAELAYAGDEPARLAYEWMRPLDLGLDTIPGSTVSVRDGSIDPPVQPGLPVDVYYVWDLADGVEAPDAGDVRIGVYERYLDPTNPIDDATTARVLVAIMTAGA